MLVGMEIFEDDEDLLSGSPKISVNFIDEDKDKENILQ